MTGALATHSPDGDVMKQLPTTSRLLLPLRLRQGVITAHIIMSVGLLGDSAGFAAVALRLSNTVDPVARRELLETLNMFSLTFGIPLSLGTLVSGIALGVGTKWGVFRYPWVMAKLLLIGSVMLVGTFVIGPAGDLMRRGGGDLSIRLVAAATYDVVALSLATALAVFKPGRPFWRADTTRRRVSAPQARVVDGQQTRPITRA
jgi:hypothetical protein